MSRVVVYITSLPTGSSLAEDISDHNIILERSSQAYTEKDIGIVLIGVRMSHLSILTTKVHSTYLSIPSHTYDSLTLQVFFTAFDVNTSLYDSTV